MQLNSTVFILYVTSTAFNLVASSQTHGHAYPHQML